AWNKLTGQLSADRGNISLVGLAVNQDGRISATTTVNENGSVRLEAADTTALGNVIHATHGGTVELGPDSSIDILPELNATQTAVADQPQLQSSVTILGEQVLMHGGSITAPSAALAVTAAVDPSSFGGAVTNGTGNGAARIRIDAGTNIDVAGSTA